MNTTLAINLAKPIASARISDDCGSNADPSVTGGTNPTGDNEQVHLIEDLKAQKNLYSEVCRTLQGLADKLSQLYDEIFAKQNEEIAKLSVEIARKILMQKIQDGDYEIESIVKEALKNAPTHDGLVVHLNPQDLTSCQKVQQNEGNETLAGLELVSDQNIGQAECVLESPKGIIKSLIDEHLEQIGKALEKTE